MTTTEKLAALRSLKTERCADILLITSDDYHQSEYVGDFFKAREYISGFTVIKLSKKKHMGNTF